MRDKKTNGIRDQLQEEIEKLGEEGEVPEILNLIRQIERANENLKKPPKKDWVSLTILALHGTVVPVVTTHEAQRHHRLVRALVNASRDYGRKCIRSGRCVG
jgi:hypothetical protein